jgi:hypothetical protein
MEAVDMSDYVRLDPEMTGTIFSEILLTAQAVIARAERHGYGATTHLDMWALALLPFEKLTRALDAPDLDTTQAYGWAIEVGAACLMWATLMRRLDSIPGLLGPQREVRHDD